MVRRLPWYRSEAKITHVWSALLLFIALFLDSGFMIYLLEGPCWSTWFCHCLGINGNVTQRQVVKYFILFLSSILFCSIAFSYLSLLCHVNSFQATLLSYPDLSIWLFICRAKSLWVGFQCPVILRSNFIGTHEIVNRESQIMKELNPTFQVGLCM